MFHAILHAIYWVDIATKVFLRSISNFYNVPATKSSLNSIEFLAAGYQSATRAICFDGSQILSSNFLLHWRGAQDLALFCPETLRSLQNIAESITLEAYGIGQSKFVFPSVPPVLLGFSRLKRLAFSDDARLDCNCAMGRKLSNFAKNVTINGLCVQNDVDFNVWLSTNFTNCGKNNEEKDSLDDLFDSQLCKNECAALPATTAITTTVSKPTTTVTTLTTSVTTSSRSSPLMIALVVAKVVVMFWRIV